ncbi:haloacid dehalogenase type II [Halorussus aquaticus]|uniref:Haloacid dehalogenase type II n=1 Tax=Halorussus aquaticus TaxID=2953748 RepID=A0ABD5Q0N6_9EURY|nr:haloacid dehalogenase type II [Halorussus aquaticus]
MDSEAVTTVTVDSYTTLVDVGSQIAALEEHVDGMDDAEAVSQRWRSQYISYSMVANDIDEYRPFWELVGQGLRYALEANGYDVSADVRDRIRSTVYEDELTVFDDVTDGIDRITDSGYEVYVLSNGNPEMLDHLVETADLAGTVTDTISADEVEVYKPDSAIYRHAADRVGTPIDRILHVSGGSMRDVWGAKHAGMRTAWLSRPEEDSPHEELGRDPDLVVEDFHDLADRLS